MKPNSRGAFALAVVLAATSACQQRSTCFRVTAFVDNSAGEVFVENFPDGAFSKNAIGNYQLAFELPPKRMPIHPPAAADSASTANLNATTEAAESNAAPPIVANQPAFDSTVPDEVYIAQFVLIDLLWHPEPGTTYVESTQTNAGLTYCLVRGRDTVRYDGAGFVYFRLDRDGRTMTGRIESATLYPSKATSESVDILGPCRVTADFVARQNARGVNEVQRKLIGPTARQTAQFDALTAD
ncbi:MAG: hypothetical protein H6819_08165 [Phycisphaerales bacterium]|nr:hypothetical protein [Phycisphaerales bacterium]MCB9854250.1 hypothetical protein [Phycisphaerales bacterium]MCB9864742.1 hypothetical protein [Phycisphaerales bacterium]